MARLVRAGADAIYAAAEQFTRSALRQADSVFTPGRPIWTSEALEELHERFVLRLDSSSETFDQKLQR